MNLHEFEMNVQELFEVDPRSEFASIRTDGINLIWTPLEGLRVFALNILAPRGEAFWNFSAFRSFVRGHHSFGSRFAERSTNRQKLEQLIAEVSMPRRSALAWMLLAGLVKPFGDAFMPSQLDGIVRSMAGRLESFLVPAGCVQAVSYYFHSQIKRFGSSCTFEVPDGIELVVSDESRRRAGSWVDLLAMPIPALTISQRHAVISDVRMKAKDVGSFRLGENLDEVFGKPGDITVGLPFKISGEEISDQIIEISRFRLEVAMSISCLPSLESIRDELFMPGWEDVQFADLRAQMLDRLARRMLVFPEISFNPFALAD